MIVDTQSVRAAAGVPKTTTGLDADKKMSGIKRVLDVDVLGLIGVAVLAASTHDIAAGTALLDQAAERCDNRLEKVLTDQGFKDEVTVHGVLLDSDIEVVRCNPEDQDKGFVPQPKRWIAEQVNGTLVLHRRPAREYDHHPDTSASRVHWPPSRTWPAASPHRVPPGATPSDWPGGRHRAPGGLQAQHDETTARASELRDQIEHSTALLAETEARLSDLATTRKVIAEPEPPETNTAYQAIVNASTSTSARRSELVSCTNSSACPPTRHPSASPAAVSDASPARASSPSQDEATTRNGLNVR
ncbi:transposase [Streptomyces syringium]|uniref:Transposase IS4-like domain-containing protein n=1 Tax=Streptomyces syringium TaxID=76729 RepID=A0ABS4Y613_9ACTN|nr:transposase [Streptomyces syringium]MBP2404179.1 hypothetical protein [Streptomyces syringium]